MFIKKSFAFLCLCFFLVSCQGQSQPPQEVNDNEANREVEQGLVLYNSTIEQSNADGNTLWRISTEKAIYAQDNQSAKIEEIVGNLFENNEIILKVKADRGEVTKEGKEIFLEGNILVIDPRNKAEFRGEEVVWKPEDNFLVVTGQDKIKASHEKLVVTAKEGIYNTKNQVLELSKDVFATTNKPTLQLTTEHLYWRIPQAKVIGNKPLNMIRFDEKIITDKLNSQQVEVDLNNSVAVISGNVEYQSIKPSLQAATTRVVWYYGDRIMESNQPTKLIQPDKGTTLTANFVKFNLEENQVYLQEGIYGETKDKESEIYADKMVWNVDNEEINAEGNVYYRQLNPDLNLKGIKAWGNLRDKNITVQGDNSTRVITNIYPEE